MKEKKPIKLKDKAYEAVWKRVQALTEEANELKRSDKSEILIYVVATNCDEDKAQAVGLMRCKAATALNASTNLMKHALE